MQIRRAKKEDRAAFAALLSEVLPDTQPHNEPNRVLDEKWRVDDMVFVAEDERGIVGCIIAGYDGHRGWLYSLAVDERARRRGTGSRLVEAALAALRERGCGKVNLQVRAGNTTGIEFWRSVGFTEEDRVSMGVRLSGN